MSRIKSFNFEGGTLVAKGKKSNRFLSHHPMNKDAKQPDKITLIKTTFNVPESKFEQFAKLLGEIKKLLSND